MAYYSRSALSSLFDKSPLEPETSSIELLQLHHSKELGKTAVKKHDVLDDGILNWIISSDHARDTEVNVQML